MFTGLENKPSPMPGCSGQNCRRETGLLQPQKGQSNPRRLRVLGLSASRLSLCLLNIHGPAIRGTQIGCVPGSASQQTQRDCCPYPDLLRIRHNSHPLQLSNQPPSDVSRGTAVSGGKRWRFLPPWKSWTWCRVLCSSAGNHFCSPLSWQAPLHTNRCPLGMYLGHFYLGFWELGNMFFCLFLGF